MLTYIKIQMHDWYEEYYNLPHHTEPVLEGRSDLNCYRLQTSPPRQDI